MASKTKKLSSLADIYQSQKLDGAITRIKLTKIFPSEDQPRSERTVGVEELAESIKRDGLLSPIVVTKEGEQYRIIAGERRFHAVNLLGWSDVECRIISREERDYYRIALIENIQRENLTPDDEAQAMLRLKKQENYSDAELSRIVGKSRSYVTEILGIASLPQEIMEDCRNAGIDNKNMMIQAVQAFKKGVFTEFLDAIQSGDIKTVKSAKEFLVGETDEPEVVEADTPQEQSKNTVVSSHTRSSPGSRGTSGMTDLSGVTLELNGSEIIIRCENAKEARKIHARLEKLIQSAPDSLADE